jgi:hypothetical protein
MIPVYHPVYAPVHPSGAHEDEVASLLAQGWSLTPEAMLTNTVRPMRPVATADVLASSEPIVDAADAAVDAMIETETAAEKKNGTTPKKKQQKK